MKTRKLLAITLALALMLALAAPTWAAGNYFPDVAADAWYAEGVHWAADAGIVKGYPDGSFGVGRACTWDEAMVMLWRAAGAKPVGDGSTDAEYAWAWLERQCGMSTSFAKGDMPISRIEFAALLYLALGDMAELSVPLPFTDLDADDLAAYGPAIRWVYGKSIMQGYGQNLFCPDVTLTREQVVTVLQRCFAADLPLGITSKEVPVYLGDTNPGLTLQLAFLDGADDVPYVEITVMKTLMESLGNLLSYAQYKQTGYEWTITSEGDRVVVTRENGYPMVLDFDKDTISFLDYDAFIRTTADGSIMDVLNTNGFDFEGNPVYLQILDTTAERYGRALSLDLGAYGIRMLRQGDAYYLPLQTICDLLLSLLGLPVAYNGAGVFLTQPTGAAAELYYSVPTGQRSPALALFSYKELCFFTDNMYGLKDQHGIRSFAEEFQMVEGMMTGLLSTDPAASDEALSKLTSYYMDDMHSGFLSNSYLEGPTASWTRTFGGSSLNQIDAMRNMARARLAAYPDGVPGYEEVGDVAFITFDSFFLGGQDYYAQAPDETATDTIGVMLYAFAQITREGSPVKHVVLDVSNNGGGAAQAAAFVIGMFLGEGSMSFKNTLTGAQVTERFRSDMNLDRVFDERDELTGYDLYCLTSPVSFSCGNLVPSVLKNSNNVTILGKTSGGGACVVLHASTADGAFFQMSGPYCISYTKNGSFYDVDQGVTPDVYIRDWETLCDRAAIADIIHGLK